MSDAQAIIEAIHATLPPQTLDIGKVYLVTDADGDRSVIDTDAYGAYPRRTARTVGVDDVASLVTYVNDLASADPIPEVWADQSGAKVVAILDPPDLATPGWCSHRAVYSLRATPEWDLWLSKSGVLMGQTEFAELIEDRAADIVRPEPAVMLELAQSFNATGKVDFQSASYLADGRRALEYRETIEAKAGRTGQIEIPATFDLALRPWWGCDPYRVVARLRYRIEGGALRIGCKLVDPARVLEAAFGDVVAAVEAGLATGTVRRGRP